MIVIAFRAETDGDFCINDERAGLINSDGGHCHSGMFLCDNTNDAEEALLNLFHSLEKADDYILAWFIRTFGGALDALLEYDLGSLKRGWYQSLSGNYEGTFLLMQEYDPKPDMDRTPLL